MRRRKRRFHIKRARRATSAFKRPAYASITALSKSPACKPEAAKLETIPAAFCAVSRFRIHVRFNQRGFSASSSCASSKPNALSIILFVARLPSTTRNRIPAVDQFRLRPVVFL
ncbi:MAG: hypothetical protein LBC53_05150 [Spirochaetaceae bacterium]|jgi:hypothetical protein|nr:hypothetical protein [Spirochaetaceae bacterium]